MHGQATAAPEPRLTRVRLYGELGQQFGREHRFAIGSPAEALRALRANHPGFERAIRADGRYVVLVDKQRLVAEELPLPTGAADVRIVPLVSGAGTVGRIVLGGALIAFSFWNPAGLAALPLFGTGATIGGIAGAVGWALALGGVSQLLFAPHSQPSNSTEAPESKPNYAFDGPVNTTAQGNPVPIGYGELLIGSQVISAGLYVEEFAG